MRIKLPLRLSLSSVTCQWLITALVIVSVFIFKLSSSGAPQDWSVDPHGEVVVGRTPLMDAILADQTPKAESLLKQNPYDCNAQDSLGWTPILCACFKGQVDVAESLIHAGANVNLTNRIGKTPLIYAIQASQSSLALTLLKHGADPDFPDDAGATPLMWAASFDDTSTVSALIADHVDLDHKDKRGFTPLSVATLSGSVHVSQLLIKAGAGVNVKVAQDANETPLMYAIDDRDEDVAASLISAHADVNVHTSDGFTPLMLACQNGLGNTVTKLLAAGAHPNASLTDGMTPLDFVCASPNGTMAIANALIASGARVNGNAHDNGTPLMYASNAGHSDIVKLLLSKGADPTRVSNRGMTALHWADGEGYEASIGAMLRKAGEVF